MNSASKKMKRDMLKKAEAQFVGVPRSKRKALARTKVDMFVAQIRKDVKEGKAYVERQVDSGRD